MKLIALFTCLVLTVSAQAQTLANDSSYAATDTTAWVSCDFDTPYILEFHALDSCNVAITLQYRGAVADATVFQTYAIEADSTNSTTAAGFWKAYLLRAGATDNIPGAERVRLIVTPKTTLNGTTSPTYDARLKEN